MSNTHITRLFLRNFRCFEEALFEFKPGFNTISGPNGQGKTSILEAIYLFIIGKSFRTPSLPELIHHDKDFFYIELEASIEGDLQRFQFHYDGKKKKVVIDKKEHASSIPLIGIIKGALLKPDDDMLIKGQPQLRRQYLDIQLSLADKSYLKGLLRYQKILNHRNALLKSSFSLSEMKAWETSLIESAIPLLHTRKSWVEKLAKVAAPLQSALSLEKDDLKITYQASIDPLTSESFEEKLKTVRDRELALQTTLLGPHREDLKIDLNSHLAKSYASVGQTRTIACALRLAEWNMLLTETHSPPLLAVDDLSLSLDPNRLEALLKELKKAHQTIITSAHNASSLTISHSE